jgi:AraC-like DNA-binding protein
MNSVAVKPHSLLQPYIQTYIYSSVGEFGENMVLDLCPVGHGVLTFILNEEHYLHNVHQNKNYNVRFNFTGQLNKYHLLHTSSASMIYVMFKPYGAFRLLGAAQNQFINECVGICDVMRGDIQDLCKKMEDLAHQPYDIIKLMEEWMLRQWRKNEKLNTDRIALACNQIIKSAGAMSIKNLCNEVSMSKSSLEQYFKDQVGISPKMFSRIIRFNNVHKYLKDSVGKDWQELVYQHGYFDQSHFIHDFKHFFGCTPSQFYLSNQNLATHLADFLPKTSS